MSDDVIQTEDRTVNIQAGQTITIQAPGLGTVATLALMPAQYGGFNLRIDMPHDEVWYDYGAGEKW